MEQNPDRAKPRQNKYQRTLGARHAGISGGRDDAIVLEGLRGEENIIRAQPARGIAASMYYGGSKEFLETR